MTESAAAIPSLQRILDCVHEVVQIVGLAGRDELEAVGVVHVQLLVDVMAARVLDISGDIAAGRGGLASHQTRVDQQPRAMADRGDRLTFVRDSCASVIASSLTRIRSTLQVPPGTTSRS